MPISSRILPSIVIAQFFCTSLWFAGNAIMPDIVTQFGLDPSYLAHLTSAVQAGFIGGTLVFAILSIADRFSPSSVFLLCALIASLVNLAISFNGVGATGLLLLRFLTGFFLAGIYPVGMKIAADYYQQGLGRSLGFLVGALVLGTAFPHLLKSIGSGLSCKYVIYVTSILSAVGGLALYLLVPDGPYRKTGQRMNVLGFLNGFRNREFRSVAIGYFGHMWELYAFWAFVPVMLVAYNNHYPGAAINVPLLSFFVIASGSIACVLSGLISQRMGARNTAAIALTISCCCCLLSPFLLFSSSLIALIVFLFIWGMSVTADSPLFSSLVAQNAPPESKGTSLTIVTSIGFAITIISIQLLNMLITASNEKYIYMLLAIGPLIGLIGLMVRKNVKRK